MSDPGGGYRLVIADAGGGVNRGFLGPVHAGHSLRPWEIKGLGGGVEMVFTMWRARRFLRSLLAGTTGERAQDAGRRQSCRISSSSSR